MSGVVSFGRVPWTRKQMVGKLEEFATLYADRPIEDNTGGMFPPHMFLAWFIKVVVLKYGGVRLYLKTRPFFMGLILGQLTPGGVYLIIAHFTGMVGNVIFWG